MGGLMAVTAFLSMWINNSSAASIMLPVALAISDELAGHERDYHDKKRATAEATAAVNGKIIIEEKSEINYMNCIVCRSTWFNSNGSNKWTYNRTSYSRSISDRRPVYINTKIEFFKIYSKFRKTEVAVQVKTHFRLPSQKETQVELIQSHEKKYDDIKKGNLYNLKAKVL
jgi:hypothetical protein